MVILWLITAALAHHETTIGRVGGGAPEIEGAGEEVPAPRIELSAGWHAIHLGRTLRGQDRYAASLGSVSATLFTPSIGLVAKSHTALRLALPVGLIHVNPEEGPAATRAGLADARITVEQRIGARTDRPHLDLRAGLAVPTGAPPSATDFEAIDITGADGEVLITTYDLRASLGSGAWLGLGGLSGTLPLGAHALTASLDGGLPLHATADQLRWGADLYARLGAELRPGLARLGLGTDARLHSRDHIPHLNELSGEPEILRTGGRTSVGVELTLGANLGRVACRTRARLPAWQRVDGVQLGETFEVGLACGGALGLRRVEASGSGPGADPHPKASDASKEQAIQWMRPGR